jgi:hypothetical protein
MRNIFLILVITLFSCMAFTNVNAKSRGGMSRKVTPSPSPSVNK